MPFAPVVPARLLPPPNHIIHITHAGYALAAVRGTKYGVILEYPFPAAPYKSQEVTLLNCTVKSTMVPNTPCGLRMAACAKYITSSPARPPLVPRSIQLGPSPTSFSRISYSTRKRPVVFQGCLPSCTKLQRMSRTSSGIKRSPLSTSTATPLRRKPKYRSPRILSRYA